MYMYIYRCIMMYIYIILYIRNIMQWYCACGLQTQFHIESTHQRLDVYMTLYIIYTYISYI